MTTTRRARRFPRATVVAVGITLSVALAGCSATEPRPEATSSPTVTAPVAPAPTPAAPMLVPDGSAADNLPYFTDVVLAVAATGSVAGRDYIDALVAAGFDKAAMEVTHDQSTVGNPAESIQFSVRWGDECLMGQIGPATGEPVTTVMRVLEGGTCHIGQTRPIDW